MKVKLAFRKGKLVQGRENLAALFHSLDGEYICEVHSLREPESVEDWRKLYFYLRDVLHSSTETGYTKNELHEALKLAIFPGLKPQHFSGATDELSTKHLNEEGWKAFVTGVKEVSINMFDLVI